MYKPVSTDGHTFKNTIGGAGDDVVELVGHAAWARHVGHAAGAIELWGEDVVQHASSVPDLEAARLDSSNLDINTHTDFLR